MQKIKNTSHILYLLFRSLCWFIPLTTTVLILFKFDWMCYIGAWSSLISAEQIRDPSHFSWLHRSILLTIEWMPMTITILICNKLARLFGLFEKGDLFEEELRVMPTKYELEDFFVEVDELSLSVERLQAHVNQLISRYEIH
jgi:hypothetical protein